MIILYCALASAHHRPVRRDSFALSFGLYAMRYAPCTLLQGRANFFMNDTKSQSLSPFMGDARTFFSGRQE
jgi:hypothetical protein